MKISIIFYSYKMNVQTNLLEDYVNFVDSTKKTYLTRIINLCMVFISLFSIFVLFDYLNE